MNKQQLLIARKRFVKEENEKKVIYKYINTMGAYILYFDKYNPFSSETRNRPSDFIISKKLNITYSLYHETVILFRCTELNNTSYFDSAEQIDAFLVMLKLIGG